MRESSFLQAANEQNNNHTFSYKNDTEKQHNKVIKMILSDGYKKEKRAVTMTYPLQQEMSRRMENRELARESAICSFQRLTSLRSLFHNLGDKARAFLLFVFCRGKRLFMLIFSCVTC